MRLQRRQRCINSSSSSCPSSGRVNGSLQHLRSPFHLDIYDAANDVHQFQCPHTSSSSQVGASLTGALGQPKCTFRATTNFMAKELCMRLF
ncbi:hypothetical protein ACLKA7_016370 [Drosophila subpalustris]